MIRVNDITGVLLVGGKSRRMGMDKAFLKIAGIPLYLRVLQTLQEVFHSVILVGDYNARFLPHQLPLYPDLYPGSAMGGLYSGLHHAATERIFVLPCDLPFPNPHLVRHLSAASAGKDVAVPVSDSGVEPLFAVYAKGCLEPMKLLLEKGIYRIRDCYPGLKVNYVGKEEVCRIDPGFRSFVNLNTPAEFALVQQCSIAVQRVDIPPPDHTKNPATIR
jgi:molybdopterin-guanine dinucleotide biosynthesis protein A